MREDPARGRGFAEQSEILHPMSGLKMREAILRIKVDSSTRETEPCQRAPSSTKPKKPSSPPTTMIAELRASRIERSIRVAMGLERMAHALRLALVGDTEPRLLARLHLRLETALRSAALLEASEELPPSQRPTLPPAPGEAPDEVWVRSERATAPPPSPSGRGRVQSDIVPRAIVEDVEPPKSARAG